MSYRLLGGAENDIDRILLQSAREWGIEAAGRYHRLMLTVFAALGDNPRLPGCQEVSRFPGLIAYPLRLSKKRVEPEQRVGRPRHMAIYRVAPDGVVEIIGMAHDRMLLVRAARRMQRELRPRR